MPYVHVRAEHVVWLDPRLDAERKTSLASLTVGLAACSTIRSQQCSLGTFSPAASYQAVLLRYLVVAKTVW